MTINMKKYTFTQLGLAAAVALIAGLFIGLAISGFRIPADNLSGTIGKVDRYRNVQVTDDDILLRNELAEDTVKRNQYEKYLMYYYYQSLKTAYDVEQVISKTKEVPAFADVNGQFLNALDKTGSSIEKARMDILIALNLIMVIDDNPNVPIIDFLNKANNGIARLRSYDQLLLDYMNTMAVYMDAHPGLDLQSLKDAHDILSINVMQSAILTQNKPILNYLDKKKLRNDEEGAKELIGGFVMNSFVASQVLSDFETISGAINSSNKLGSIGPYMNSSISSQQLDISIFNSQQLAAVTLSVQTLDNSINSQNFFQSSISTGFSSNQSLNAINSQTLLNSDVLNLINAINSTQLGFYQ
jgi:hypothetical protein